MIKLRVRTELVRKKSCVRFQPNHGANSKCYFCIVLCCAIRIFATCSKLFILMKECSRELSTRWRICNKRESNSSGIVINFDCDHACGQNNCAAQLHFFSHLTCFSCTGTDASLPTCQSSTPRVLNLVPALCTRRPTHKRQSCAVNSDDTTPTCASKLSQ